MTRTPSSPSLPVPGDPYEATYTPQPHPLAAAEGGDPEGGEVAPEAEPDTAPTPVQHPGSAASGDAAAASDEALDAAVSAAPQVADPPIEQTHAVSPSHSGARSPGTRSRSRPGVRSGSFWEDSSPSALHVGRLVADRWEVGDRIGMGGMASVHSCIDQRLDRLVAIKILHPHISESEDARKRLAREARAIAQLKHESVIEVYDYAIEDPDCTWLVTELIDGESLREALDHNPRPIPEVATMIVFEIVRALQAAHRVGIVHRDVKPDNVLIGANGRPKLSDFGIAQVISEDRMTLTGNLVGSPSYMSPEQAEGRRTDHRTDLFSAGVVLYRLVTGVLPFPGQNAIETLRKVAAVDCIDPTELEPSCPATIAGIIRKSMAPKIDDRYQTADEMLADLNAILEDCGLTSTWQELPRFFEDAERYQHELAGRLSKTLAARGQILMDAGDEPRALDCFNRAMTLGANNEQTYDLVRVLSKRRDRGRLRRMLYSASAAFGAVALIIGALVATEALDGRFGPKTGTGAAVGAPATPATPRLGPPITTGAPAPSRTVKASEAPATPAIAPQTTKAAEPAPAPAPPTAIRRQAISATPAPKPQATPSKPVIRAKPAPKAAAKPSRPKPAAQPEPTAAPEAKPEPEPVTRPPPPRPARGTLQIGSRRWVDVYIDGVRLGRAPDRSRYDLPPGEHRLKAVNPHCNPMEKVVKIQPDQTTRVRLKLVCP